jgi:hypothetical protein
VAVVLGTDQLEFVLLELAWGILIEYHDRGWADTLVIDAKDINEDELDHMSGRVKQVVVPGTVLDSVQGGKHVRDWACIFVVDINLIFYCELIAREGKRACLGVYEVRSFSFFQSGRELELLLMDA